MRHAVWVARRGSRRRILRAHCLLSKDERGVRGESCLRHAPWIALPWGSWFRLLGNHMYRDSDDKCWRKMLAQFPGRLHTANMGVDCYERPDAGILLRQTSAVRNSED